MTISRRMPFVAPNWNGIFGRGLRFLIVPMNGGLIDLVTGEWATAQTSTTRIETAAGPHRDQLAAAMASASSDWWSFQQDARFQLTGNLTLFWAGTISSGSAFRAFADNHVTDGAVNNPFDFRTDNSAAVRPVLLRANATVTAHHTGATGLTSGVYQSVAFSGFANPSTAALLVTNGASDSVVTGGGGATTVTASTDTLIRIGRRGDGATQMNGFMNVLAGWDDNFDVVDLERLHSAWHIELMKPVRRLWSIAAAAGTFKPFFANQLGGFIGVGVS